MKLFTVALIPLLLTLACSTKSSSQVKDASSGESSQDPTKGDCPTDQIKALSGSFSGKMTQLNTDGTWKSSDTADESQVITDCDAFSFKVQYKDDRGTVVREVDFAATWDQSESLFKISGPNIDGVLRVIKQKTFLASFNTSFPVGPVTCDELWSLTNGNKELARSVQCRIGGNDGPLYGTRSFQGFRVAP